MTARSYLRRRYRQLFTASFSDLLEATSLSSLLPPSIWVSRCGRRLFITASYASACLDFGIGSAIGYLSRRLWRLVYLENERAGQVRRCVSLFTFGGLPVRGSEGTQRTYGDLPVWEGPSVSFQLSSPLTRPSSLCLCLSLCLSRWFCLYNLIISYSVSFSISCRVAIQPGAECLRAENSSSPRRWPMPATRAAPVIIATAVNPPSMCPTTSNRGLLSDCYSVLP